MSVDVLREQVKGATALIFATPEYNGSMSGVLKNAYDWLSRDYSKQGGDTPPVAGKKSGTNIILPKEFYAPPISRKIPLPM